MKSRVQMRHKMRKTFEKLLESAPSVWSDLISLKECDAFVMILANDQTGPSNEPKPIGVCLARMVGGKNKTAVIRAEILDKSYQAQRLAYETETILMMSTELLANHADVKTVGAWYRTGVDSDAIRELEKAGFTTNDPIKHAEHGEKFSFVMLRRADWDGRALVELVDTPKVN